MITVVEERMSEHFTKHHLINLGFDAVLHHFTSVSDEIHDHPFDFVSHVLSGGYVERVYYALAGGSWRSELIRRMPGTVHSVKATHIHQIVELPAGECRTIIIPQPKIREPRFWRFGENGFQSRAWNEEDFV